MHLNTTPDRTQRISARARQRLLLLFLLIAILTLSVTALGIVRMSREIGKPFGGFLWALGDRDRPFVMPDAPYYWPGFAAGLRPMDTILTVDGRSPSPLARIYNEKLGQTVVYEIQRGGQRLTIQGPVVSFTRQMFFEAYGPRLLSGLVALVVAGLLFRGTPGPALMLVSFILLVIGALLLNHVNGPRVHSNWQSPLPSALLWAYGYPFLGAMLWHLSLTFPQPRDVLRRHSTLTYAILYGLALVVGTAYFVSIWPPFGLRHIEGWTSPAFLGSLASGGAATIVSGLWAYIAPPVGKGNPDRAQIRTLAVAWVLAVLLYAYIGIGRALLTAPWATVLMNIADSTAVLFPLLLLYGVRSMELMEQLQHQVVRAQRMADELGELRGIRERTLHEVADALHDTVVADVRGLQLWLSGMRRRYSHRGTSSGVSMDPGELAFLEGTLEKIYRDARRIMEGAKPVDFAEEGLLKPLERSLAHFRQANPGLEVCLEIGPYDEEYPTVIKEEIYWIVQTALANSRDHAGARRIVVRLSKEENRLRVIVRDDGAGFDIARAFQEGTTEKRRRLGLRNMQMRAARIGAELTIESGLQGTEVRVEVAVGGAQ